ncbi:MAG TPA: hemolysin family protein [Rhodothermales bacterium]|nr:hemolysin family protein [Rhodothermales bacterium]
MFLLVFYVLLALGVSFLCSIMEAVLLSVTPSFVAVKEQQDDPLAEQLRKLKEDIDRPLAAILSLNTIAHTVGAAGAGAQAVAVFGDAFVGVISGVLTLLILVVSEIIPKTIGAVYWKQLTPAIVRILRPIIWLMWPLVKLAQGITYLMGEKKKSSVSRAEIAAMAELGKRQGVFEAGESRILKNLFRFSSLRVRDVMTPRTVIFALPQEKTVGAVLEEHEAFRFSRIPIYNENRDDVTGYILKDELFLRAAEDKHDLELKAMRRPILVVPDSLLLPDAFERMLEKTDHVALVVDEYGGTEGLVTLEDIVETLLGLEIVDEADSVDDMQTLAREQWRQRAERLGIITEEDVALAEQKQEAVIRLGLTGGRAPVEEASEGEDA